MWRWYDHRRRMHTDAQVNPGWPAPGYEWPMWMAILLLAAAMGCAPRGSQVAVTHVRPAAPLPRVRPCGEPREKTRAACPDDRVLFLGAHNRGRSSPTWGAGVAAIELPRGFERRPAPRPYQKDAEAEEGGDRLPDEDVRDHVATYRISVDGGETGSTFLEATVRVLRRPAPATRPKSLFRYLVATYDGNREDVTPEIEDASLAHWFNWAEELQDDRGRRVVEWGYVQKGCERAELFEHFVEDGRWIWQVQLEAEPTVPAAQLAEWLWRFFDAPFGGPLPKRRAALSGEQTPR